MSSRNASLWNQLAGGVSTLNFAQVSPFNFALIIAFFVMYHMGNNLLSDVSANGKVLKFFLAEANGGIKALSALSAPLPHLKFMPTGGITQASVPDYLALPNVIAVGGTWIVNRP